VTYQTVRYGYHRNENNRRNLKKINLSKHTVRCRIGVVSCENLDHVADEIQSNKTSLPSAR